MQSAVGSMQSAENAAVLKVRSGKGVKSESEALHWQWWEGWVGRYPGGGGGAWPKPVNQNMLHARVSHAVLTVPAAMKALVQKQTRAKDEVGYTRIGGGACLDCAGDCSG